MTPSHLPSAVRDTDRPAGTTRAVHDAARTLARATAFLAAGLRHDAGAAPASIAGPYRAKVLGNALRELDRFLNLLTDAAADAIGGTGMDRARFGRLRNTPNKLRLVRGAMALGSPDHHRLRAVGRSRDCLFHRGGSTGAAPARPGWFSPAAGHEGSGGTLAVTSAELAELCGFYDAVAADLLLSVARHRGIC